MDWATWVQQTAGGLLQAKADATYQQPYEIEKLRLQALGDTGVYNEGQTGVSTTQSTGINTKTALMIGGALVLAIVLVKS
jgi:hypothetical protein